MTTVAIEIAILPLGTSSMRITTTTMMTTATTDLYVYIWVKETTR
jgi:hypothetical protein